MSTILPPTNNWGDVPADATTPPSVIGRLHRWRKLVVHRLRTSKIAACSGCDAIAGKNTGARKTSWVFVPPGATTATAAAGGTPTIARTVTSGSHRPEPVPIGGPTPPRRPSGSATPV